VVVEEVVVVAEPVSAVAVVVEEVVVVAVSAVAVVVGSQLRDTQARRR